MLTNLRFLIPRRSSRRTSPSSARQRASDSESAASPPEGLSTVEGAGPSEPRHIDTHLGAISSIQFLPDGKHIVAGGDNGMVRQWKVEEGTDHASEVGKPICSQGKTNAAVVSKDGKWIVLAGVGGRSVTVWDATTHERVVETIEAHDEQITALDISQDASKIASGSRDGTVFIWCLETGLHVAGPLKGGRSVLSVRFSPTGDCLASAGPDFSIHVWSIYSDRDLPAKCVPTDRACSLAWSHDGRCLFAGSNSGSILCFDVSNLASVRTKWPGHTYSDSISTLRLSNNGKFIISASSSERSVKIWDVRTQRHIHSLPHTSDVLDVEISPDDGRLVSGTKDGKISIWSLKKDLPIQYFFRCLSARMMPQFHTGSHPILTEISNAAYIQWKRAELAGAEAILSSEIECGSSPSHYHFANRALLRARLRRWDGALDDAEESFRIKPSLIALVAKCVAQFGQQKFDSVIGMLDEALENYCQEEKDFFNVVKAITLFDAGYRDAAIGHVDNLVAHSPDASHPCAFVQARMYTRLGEDAMDTQQYVNAMSLFARARDLCPSSQYPEMDTLSLIGGWVFDDLRLAIYRHSSEACYATRCIQEALDTVREMERIFRDEITLRGELKGWLVDIKSRCAEELESQGDLAMHHKDYVGAITRYSEALAIFPTASPTNLLAKRIDARMASRLWEDALKDADEVIRLDHSSPWGYERRHAALHELKRYNEAIDALKTMLTLMENSSDPEIQQLRAKYINPSDTKNAILDALRTSDHDSPIRLIDTTSGRLCDAEKRRIVFTEDPIFQELISSMTTQVSQDRIDTVTKQYFQYVMLSHRWEARELKLSDIVGKSVYELEASPSAAKLQQFCFLARDANFRWAWSDTCCIDKDRDVEFEKSINLMFHWYRSSAATFVYLTGTPPQMIPGALGGSIWMTRGWTLQELLAPPIIRFYHQDWTPYLNNTSPNHKESALVMQELEDATGVAKHDLLAFQPGPENIRVKLRLASKRETTVPVDMAYGLFGIFGIKMPVIHGESQQEALGRLFQEIIATSGDVTCISWVGRSSEFNSAFPNDIRVYEHQPCTTPHIDEEDMEIRVANLRRTWTRENEAQAVAFYLKLYKLSPARCIKRHLYLPCIVFPLKTFKKVKRTDGVRIYRATSDALEDTDIHTEKLLSSGQGPEDLVLACPWIHELLDTTPLPAAHHRHPSGELGSEPGTESESESESESEQEEDTSAQVPTIDSHGRIAGPASLPRLELLPDTSLKALKLAVRYKQPLGGLLLLAQGHGQYRRVATDHDITIRVRDKVSLVDMIPRVQTLDVI